MVPLSENLSSGGRSMSLDVFLPAPSGIFPAVLVLHGSFGLLPQYKADIVSFAEAFVNAGIAAVMPHYLETTCTDPGMGVLSQIPEKLRAWNQACSDTLASMAKDPRFDAKRIGTLGFSLGGLLALTLGMDPPPGTTLKCVVDFFGPAHLLEPHWPKMPPVLIFHGTKDPLVSPAESAALVDHLKAAGKKEGSDYIFKPYKDEGHGFKGAALASSRDETISFFKATL